MTGRIKGEIEVGAEPSRDELAQQGRKQSLISQSHWQGMHCSSPEQKRSRNRWRSVSLLPRGSEGGKGGVLAGAVGKEGAINLEGKTVGVCRTQVREVVNKGAMELVVFRPSAHSTFRHQGE